MAFPVLFFPGWGFDGRVAELLPCLRGRQWWAPLGFSRPAMLAEAQELLLAQAQDKVEVLGWSLGANLACDFVQQFPQQVASLTLVGMRQSWPVADITAIKQGLALDMEDFMTQFYRQCFLGQKEVGRSFRQQLQGDYLGQLDQTILRQGLDYLAGFRQREWPSALAVHVVHGARDVIAPWEERVKISGARTTDLPNDGHFPAGLAAL